MPLTPATIAHSVGEFPLRLARTRTIHARPLHHVQRLRAPMILVSCRRDFESNKDFSAELAVRHYPSLSNLTRFDDLTMSAVADAVAGKHALVLVHGYRNPLPKLAAAYAVIDETLVRLGLVGERRYGIVLGFMWPGFKLASKFKSSVGHANRSAEPLRQLCATISRSAHSLDVQTHSLGARVALTMLSTGDETFVDNLLMTAPAVDDEGLEPDQEFHGALDHCRRCVVYHSKSDPVLRKWYRLAQHDRALGDSGPESPATIAGKCPSVFVVDASHVVSSHGGYRKAPPYYRHWERILDDSPMKQFDTL